MRWGVFIFPSHEAIDVAELAVEAEAAGFDCLLFPEHTHVPLVDCPPSPAGAIPDSYAKLLDPIVAMAMAGSVTTALRVGTGICLLAQRDPIVFAKQIGSVEHAIGGRTVLGVGAGWNRKEAQNHGVDPARRWDVMREHVLAARAIWTSDEPEFHGEHVDFDRLALYPKPVQLPHPPFYVGGNSERAMRAAVEYGDGWIPSLGLSQFAVAEEVRRAREMAQDAGRDRLPVVLMRPEENETALEEYAEAGIDVGVFGLPTAGRDEVLAELERLHGLVARAAA